MESGRYARTIFAQLENEDQMVMPTAVIPEFLSWAPVDICWT